MLIIWGRANSVNVQKVLWCCAEMGTAFERRDVGGPFGVVDTAEYRKLNPNGLVPTIDDEGFVLWESHAIVRYLAAKHATGTLCPAEPPMRALADQWMDWLASTLWPSLRPLFIGFVRTPTEKRDGAALEKARQQTAALLVILDDHLKTRAFAAGDQFTMADIVLGCAMWRWMGLPIERPLQPNLQRWFERLLQRPAYQSIVMQPLN